jgi:hypothetical protein
MLYKILNWCKSNLLLAIITILVIVVVLQRCERNAITSQEIIVKRDTVWKKVTDTIVTKPKLVKTIVGKPEIKIKYVADPNYDRLVIQYNGLVDKYIEQNIQTDSILIDSIGYINITDTISENLIIGRKTSYSFKYPEITNTITLPYKAKTQVYFGGGVQAVPNTARTAINAGLLLKTNKDKIFNIYVGMDTHRDYQVGIQTYWKIKLKK